MRRYRVTRRGLIVQAILDALEQSGAVILKPPDPQSAPFEIKIQTPSGEAVDLICYAFLANEYRQKGRPKNEHRFQVKYGSDFAGYHRLYIPKEAYRVTLMLGVHLEAGLFIACDPAMHEWTRFSRSVEFKQHHLDLAHRTGWAGWERDRSDTRRKVPPPKEDARTEVLVAFRPERFLQYVGFERLATGIDPGERLLLADKLGAFDVASSGPELHPLEKELGLSAHDILDMIGGAFRLKTAVRGRAAEHHLGEFLEGVDGVTEVHSIDKDGKPDFEIVYHKRPVRIECKNVLRKTPASGIPRVDFQKTRAAKGNPCSRYYRASQFEVLAACLHPITEAWEYRFVSTGVLAPHEKCVGRLSHRVSVEGPGWSADLGEVLDSL